MKLSNATYKLYSQETSPDGSVTDTLILSGLGWVEEESQWRIIEGEVKIVANAVLYVWDEFTPMDKGWAEVNSTRREIVKIHAFRDYLTRWHHAEVWLL